MGYPIGTANDPAAPWNEPDVSHLFECGACGEILNRYEQCDPCEIGGETYCDKCTSDLTYLRLNYPKAGVSIKTKKLKS